jgi:hypothetical protein
MGHRKEGAVLHSLVLRGKRCRKDLIARVSGGDCRSLKGVWWGTEEGLSYPVFMPKPSTHRMNDPGSIVPHIRSKVFTDNQMPRITYNYYYINSVSKDYDDSQQNRTAKDSITPQERQPGQYVAYNSSSKNSSPSSPSEQQIWVAGENSKVDYTYG